MNARMSVIIAVAASFLLLFFNQEIGSAKELPRHLAATKQKVTIVLQRVYLDGDMSEEVITETANSMHEIQERYEQWQLIDKQDSKLVFRLCFDDISPLLKANGYFGITDEGILTIFNGKPKHSKIIHSFYQIDVGKLESRKKQQLMKGIPIKTKDRYQQVLETFKPYTKYE
ncbi:Forespore regulator of the sigma-K checkpoint, BofC [Bacillus sp. DNRA2]|uniref:BofC C-terminal domain-containing protein n=1 Tax=Bacillus sp. DNRA2 TaxID=2723053 RepID=UPI00145D013A|nr:BofC C-terminal domain-containing protein [Bacillus sp. DNRA2]NMD70568.1 Forespore regulator of the sigma-K checkpoint, BofC [Bacillus sp. DNRA2]